MEFRNPIFDIKASGKNKDRLEALKDDFNELSSKEKFDVVEFQNLMMASLSKCNELSKSETDVNGIISRMSSRSLDHSQRCMSYLKSNVACKKDE